MKIVFLIILFQGFLNNVFAQFNYPYAKEVKHYDTVHGNVHYDPYRWLENYNDTTVRDWFRKQNNFTESVLSKIPYRDSVLKDLHDVEKLVASSMSKLKFNGMRYYYIKYDAQSQVASLFYKDGLSGKEILIYNPATYPKKAGQQFDIIDYFPSWDNSKVVIAVTHDGTEHRILLTYDLVQKMLYPHQVDKAGYVLWLPDNKKFIYLRTTYYPWEKPADQSTYYANAKVFIHKAGESHEKDVVIFDRNHYPELKLLSVDNPQFIITDPQSPFLFFQQKASVNQNTLWILRHEDIGKRKIEFKKITDKTDGIISFLHHGNNIYFLSDKASPSYTIRKATLRNPLYSTAKKLITTTDEPIREFGVTHDKILYVQTKGVEAKILSLTFRKGANPVELKLPFSSYIYELKRPLNVGDNILLPLESWTRPTELWLFEGSNNKLIKTDLEQKVDHSIFKNLIVKEVYIPSHDGVLIPLSIIYDKKLKKESTSQAWLLAYGSYGTVLSPYFMPEELLKCRYGVVWAIAHVRGGGELGKTWHEGGKKENKPNTWKDFIACGEYLIKEGFTVKDKLIAEGGSAGGITVGRAITERPDLFAVAIPVVGDMDKLIEHNLGPFNAREFGSIKDSINYNHLLEMSSYRKIIKGKRYPAQFIMIGWNDPRIPPWQGGKFAARMQAASVSGKPVLLHIDFTGGHSGGKVTDNLKATADKITFALSQTGHPAFKEKY